ncbi:MAG: heparinase II/III family protein [Candidatus Latescibacterota bacterium]
MSASSPAALAPDTIRLPRPLPWPAVACTPEELERLRAALRGSGSESEVVQQRVVAAEEALQRTVDFPPEGGQHNQWYQCDACQVALQTMDEKHHRCPQCQRLYSGYPYDHVIYARQHNDLTRDMTACAWAFALTGEARFAARARAVLLGYAERYLDYPYHSANMGKREDKPSNSGGHVFEQTLNEATWARPVCETYDLLRRWEGLSAADHEAIRTRLLHPLHDNIARHRAGRSNWQTYHDSAFLYLGGALEDEEMVRRAILDPENGFLYQMRDSVLPGGMWYENSWSYHFYTLEAVRRIAETARRLGIELWSVGPVKEMHTVALGYRMVDETLPRFGDATTTGIPGGLYESAHHRWPEDGFVAVLPEAPTWDAVLYGRRRQPREAALPLPSSRLEEGSGHALLHLQGPEGRSSAALTFGPFGGFHGHFDKLSFVYFALGQELGYDPGRARSQAYRLPVHRDWYRATLGHNTVLVDRASQQGAAGACEVFVANEEVAAAAARTQAAYPGVLHRRLLVLRPGFLLVADALTTQDGREHTFDWLYHNRGRTAQSPAAREAGSAPEGPGFEYLQEVRTGRSEGPLTAAFLLEEGRVEVTVGAAAGTHVLTGTGVGESVQDRVPLLCITRRGPAALFAAAIDPTPAGRPAEVSGVEIEAEGDDLQGQVEHHVRVALADGSEEIYAWAAEPTQRSVCGVGTRARLLCLRRAARGAWVTLAEAR